MDKRAAALSTWCLASWWSRDYCRWCEFSAGCLRLLIARTRGCSTRHRHPSIRSTITGHAPPRGCTTGAEWPPSVTASSLAFKESLSRNRRRISCWRCTFLFGWDPFFTDSMTLEAVYRYPTKHFDFHRRQLTLWRLKGRRVHRLFACGGFDIGQYRSVSKPDHRRSRAADSLPWYASRCPARRRRSWPSA